MATSPASNADGIVSLNVLLDGATIASAIMVMSINITHRINRVPMAQVVLAENVDLEQSDFLLDDAKLKPGTEISIELGYNSTNALVFKGIIVKNTLRAIRSGAPEIVLECRHKVAKLTLDKKSKVFTDKKDSDVISEIVSGAGLSADCTATEVQHKQLVQYHSSDWDFILNRAEATGMFAFISPDAIKIAPPTYGSSILGVTYGVDIAEVDLQLDARYQYGSITSHGWNPADAKPIIGASKEPSLNSQGNIEAKNMKTVLGSETYNQYASSFLTQQELEGWSNARLLRARLSRIQGKVTFFGNATPKVGDILEISKFSQRFNGEAYITGVIHSVSDGTWDTVCEIGLSETPYYEEQRTSDMPVGGLLPAVSGLQIGIVVKLDADPLGLGRIQIQLPMAEDDMKVWARLSSYYASNAVGSYFYPEVNDEIIVGFINDDPRDAIVLGSVHGKNTPPYTIEAKNNTKGIVTREKMKLTFDEEKKIITVETPGGNKIVLDDDKKSITLTDSNNNKVSLDDKGITLDTPKDVKITAKGKIGLEAVGAVEIKSSGGDVKLEGLNVQATAQIGATVKGNATAEISASGQTTVKGAMVMIN